MQATQPMQAAHLAQASHQAQATQAAQPRAYVMTSLTKQLSCAACFAASSSSCRACERNNRDTAWWDESEGCPHGYKRDAERRAEQRSVDLPRCGDHVAGLQKRKGKRARQLTTFCRCFASCPPARDRRVATIPGDRRPGVRAPAERKRGGYDDITKRRYDKVQLSVARRATESWAVISVITAKITALLIYIIAITEITEITAVITICIKRVLLCRCTLHRQFHFVRFEF